MPRTLQADLDLTYNRRQLPACCVHAMCLLTYWMVLAWMARGRLACVRLACMHRHATLILGAMRRERACTLRIACDVCSWTPAQRAVHASPRLWWQGAPSVLLQWAAARRGGAVATVWAVAAGTHEGNWMDKPPAAAAPQRAVAASRHPAAVHASGDACQAAIAAYGPPPADRTARPPACAIPPICCVRES